MDAGDIISRPLALAWHHSGSTTLHLIVSVKSLISSFLYISVISHTVVMAKIHKPWLNLHYEEK